MSKHTKNRINQAVMKVVFDDKTIKWFRVSRRNFGDLVNYWQRQSSFYYAKIYHINNYKKTPKGSKSSHDIGHQIAYITRKGSALSPYGLNESQSSEDYKRRMINK